MEEVIGPIFSTTQKMADGVEFFKTKKIKNTRFVDTDTLNKIGVLKTFYELTGRAGIQPRFWEIKRPTYKRLTIEFLASMTIDESKDDLVFSYRLLDANFQTSASELAACLGFVPGGTHKGEIADCLWKDLTGRDEVLKGQPNARHIQHPVFRIIQRALAHTIFARGESASKARKEELVVMSRMLYASSTKLDLANMMIRYWHRVATYRREGEGDITLGGYVTCLAELKGIDPARLADLARGTGLSSMDIPHLRTIGFLVGPDNGPWLWKNSIREPIPLPLEVPLHPQWKRTWLLPSARVAGTPDATQPQDQEGHQVPPLEPHGQPPPFHLGTSSSSAPPPPEMPQGFDYAALCASLQNITRLSNESLEMGQRIGYKMEEIEREQALARHDINLLLGRQKEEEETRKKVNEMYEWLFPRYGPKPDDPAP